MPAFCFTLQNNLQFVAASHLGAAPCVADVLPRVAEAAEASGGVEQRLLAVGAGLRTGAALYDGKGALLKYERLKCGSRAEMRKAAAAWTWSTDGPRRTTRRRRGC